jgi:SAM-dependent methyltransferase
MITPQELERRIKELADRYGEWTFDIPLPYELWTRGNEGVPHTRLRRIVQIVQDMTDRPFESLRILDLGALDGIFSIEFALRGATVVGIEVREANIQKALFAQCALQLANLEFVQDDVRNVTLEKYGTFDFIVCSGILYHLNTPDVFHFIEHMYAMLRNAVVIDTHITLQHDKVEYYKDKSYHGSIFTEHNPSDPAEAKKGRLWRSWGNDQSFRFTRPSLINFLGSVGFSSVYECFNPPHLNRGLPGIEWTDRCTFVARKGREVYLHTSPAANTLREDWPEGTLSY